MDENTIDTLSASDSGQLSNNEMLGVYRALSVVDNTDIDTIDEYKFIQECIEEVFDSQFKLIDSESLQDNAMLLNNKFVELLKFCNTKAKYKKVGCIFIGFCDYFDLNGTKVYSNFHEKIQLLIQNSAKCMCGATQYNKLKQENSKHPTLNIPTLFDLIKK